MARAASASRTAGRGVGVGDGAGLGVSVGAGVEVGVLDGWIVRWLLASRPVGLAGGPAACAPLCRVGWIGDDCVPGVNEQAKLTIALTQSGIQKERGWRVEIGRIVSTSAPLSRTIRRVSMRAPHQGITPAQNRDSRIRKGCQEFRSSRRVCDPAARSPGSQTLDERRAWGR